MDEKIVVRRNRGSIRWGFSPHQTDLTLMVGNNHMLRALAKAYEHLGNGRSYREVARWLGSYTGQPYDFAALARAYRRWRQAREVAAIKAPTMRDVIDAPSLQ